MLERCVIALELVGRLQKFGLEFIFKGGTCILLHVPAPKRLSIDVDIICLEKRDRIEEALNEVVKELPFTSWNYQAHRERDEPPTKHYEVFFNSVTNPTVQGRIIIDVIEGESPYSLIVNKELITSFIEPTESIQIPVPSISSLLGDKLAAFAPETIGYPYEPLNRRGEPDEPRPANVVKHLFDVGQLSLLAENLGETIDTYLRVHKEQCQWRGEHELIVCLEDTQAAAVMASRVDRLNEQVVDGQIEFFRKGIRSVASHMFTDKFGRTEARLSAGRAALVAEIVKKGDSAFELRAFLEATPDLSVLKSAELTENWALLERLKRTDISAYACWLKAQQLKNRSISL